MICEECKKQGLKSRVTPGHGSSTAMYCAPFYDEDGKYHALSWRQAHDRALRDGSLVIEPQMFMAVIGMLASLLAAGFAWMWKVAESRKERDERNGDQLREIERLLREMNARDEARDARIDGRFDETRRPLRSIMTVLEQLVGPDAASRDAVRRELSFLAERMVKLERAAPLAVRCDPAEAGDGEVRCPYCHGGLGDVDLVRCSRCEAKQHRDCHESHGGCAVFGCGSRETRAVGTRVA